MQFQQDGHDRLVDLPRQPAFVGEVEILDQLLGQGATPLHHGARLDIAQHRPCNGHGVDAQMAVEAAVLHRQQGVDEQRRQLPCSHQHPVLVVGGIDAGDQGRVQPHQGGIGTAVGVLEPYDGTLFDRQVQKTLGLRPVPEAERAGAHQKAVAVTGVGTWSYRLVHLVELETLQLSLQGLRRQGAPGVEFQGPSVDPGGQRPAFTLELGANHRVHAGSIEHAHEPCGENQKDKRTDQEAQEASARTTTGRRPISAVPTRRVRRFVALKHGSETDPYLESVAPVLEGGAGEK